MVKTKVLLADDHNLVRKGIKSAITSNPDIEVIAEAATGPEVLSKLEEEIPDVVVTDISMPGISGLQLCEIIKSKYPDIGILILSMHKDTEYVVRAFEIGALGYLTKDSDEVEFYKAIKSAESGIKYLNPFVSEALAKHFVRSSSSSANDKLTNRESEILLKIVEGLSNKQIAEALVISARTVDTHRTNMMKKLNAGNTAELVRIALTKKLI